jgi:hypothetical protein
MGFLQIQYTAIKTYFEQISCITKVTKKGKAIPVAGHEGL